MNPSDPNQPAAPQPSDPALATPQPSEPAMQAPAPQPLGATPQQPAFQPPVDAQPGKGLAIAGIILSVVGMQLIGLILSIIAKKKAVKPSSVNTMAIIGIILNIVFGIITLLAAAGIVLVAYAGIQSRAMTSQGQSAAISVKNTVIADALKNHELPSAASDVTLADGVSLGALSVKPSSPETVEYSICDNGSVARFGYWDYTNNYVIYNYENANGSVTTGNDCTVVQ